MELELLLLYIAMFINSNHPIMIVSNWLCSCVYSNNFVHFFFLEWIGNGTERYGQPDQFLVARTASAVKSPTIL